MPVLGVIFLRHATNRYNDALRHIQVDQDAGRMPKRPLMAADFKKRRALMPPESAGYDALLALPKEQRRRGQTLSLLRTLAFLDRFPRFPSLAPLRRAQCTK
jgi:hypothetical protein